MISTGLHGQMQLKLHRQPNTRSFSSYIDGGVAVVCHSKRISSTPIVARNSFSSANSLLWSTLMSPMNRKVQSMHQMDTIFREYCSLVSLFHTVYLYSLTVDHNGNPLPSIINVGGIPDKKYYHGGINSVIDSMKLALQYTTTKSQDNSISNDDHKLPLASAEITTTTSSSPGVQISGNQLAKGCCCCLSVDLQTVCNRFR